MRYSPSAGAGREPPSQAPLCLVPGSAHIVPGLGMAGQSLRALWAGKT
ncbi:hypothetical protein BN2364_1891 [Alloalcanivorax xenomutans]|nr:hypothetical protein BN2364_1891 [Alloalcanivorax xenomutans]